MRKLWIIMLFFCLVSFVYPAAASASAAATTDISANSAQINFPETVTFKAHLKSDKKITTVMLEYGDEQLTCGNVIAEAFPQFTPASQLDVEWTWEMRQTGSLPPGAQVWWRWHVTDENGVETISERQTITWLDAVHQWQTISDKNLNVHWYEGDKDFAGKIMDAAKTGLTGNETRAGLKPDGTIDLYIYANPDDLKVATLYAPSWTGGQAFPKYNIVIIGIGPNNLAWGTKAVVHELTHVLVGHLTYSCLNIVPTWLNEGLAVNSEGSLGEASQAQLDDAISNNTLMSVRSLSGGFSEIADKANLSYSVSYSITKFLVDSYGQEKMTALLTSLRDGASIDEALVKVYAFNVEGLEDAWRTEIGAQARAVTPNATATPPPTDVPTIVPASGAPLAVTPTPFSIPTSSTASNPPTQSPSTGSQSPSSSSSNVPLILTGTLLLLCCCLIMLIVIAVIVAWVVIRRKGAKNA